MLLVPNLLPIPVFVQVLSITFFIIYVGSHNSLRSPQTEVMQTKDAYMFPLIASVMLSGLYVVYKLFDKYYVNMVLRVYFLLFGVLALCAQFGEVASGILPKGVLDAIDNAFHFRIPFLWKKKTVPDATGIAYENLISNLELLLLIPSAIIGIQYFTFNHPILNNIFGVAFCIQGLSYSLGSILNGCVLLAGLFVYDIFWVFGTDVMVTVAKSFDAPIKLLFPQMDGGSPSMLGLGDIVIPGMYIALLLHFDRVRSSPNPAASTSSASATSSETPPTATTTSSDTSSSTAAVDSVAQPPAEKPFPSSVEKFSFDSRKPYFWICMWAYVAGLGVTLGCMYFFGAAQPALLYLVPACLGSSVGTSLFRREFSALMSFKDERGEKEKKKQ